VAQLGANGAIRRKLRNSAQLAQRSARGASSRNWRNAFATHQSLSSFFIKGLIMMLLIERRTAQRKASTRSEGGPLQLHSIKERSSWT